jgi:hypothetical protein
MLIPNLRALLWVPSRVEVLIVLDILVVTKGQRRPGRPGRYKAELGADWCWEVWLWLRIDFPIKLG